MAETVRKEVLQEKPVEAWYRDRVERWVAARENGKKDLEVLHYGELKMGPGNLTLSEWDQKMRKEERDRHGSKAYSIVFCTIDAKTKSR